MKALLFITIILPLILLAVVLFFPHPKLGEAIPKPTKSATISKVPQSMKLVSSAFEHNQKIPAKYTCQGEGINPPLQFLDTPKEAKSLVLIVDDPDAPMGTWVHWVVFNMEPQTLGIEESSKPTSGIEAMTSFGKPGYGGPCPPSGTHRYFFKLYALDTMLDLTATADKKAVEAAIGGHILAQTELIGLFSK